MHSKRDSRTFQKQPQHSVIQQSKKCSHGAISIPTPSRAVKSVLSHLSSTRYSLSKFKSGTQHTKNCSHVNKNCSNTSNQNRNNLANSTSINKVGKAQVIYKRCDHSVPSMNSTNGGIPQNSKEMNKKSENANKNVPTTTPNAKPLVAQKSEKGTVSAASKPCEPNASKSTSRPHSANNNVPQEKNAQNAVNKNENLKNGAKINPVLQKVSANPCARNYNASSSNDNTITEIFKRQDAMGQGSETKFNNVPPYTENLNFQRVTQELASIIKNFQKQMQDAPLIKTKMEEVPSAMIQPKIKEFFKKPKQPVGKTETPSNSNKNHVNKKQSDVKKNQIPSKNSHIFNKVSEHNSLKKLSGTNVSPKSSDIRQFRSMTNHNLSMKLSSSSRKVFKRASSQTIDPLKQLKDEVHKAIREHKTFTIRGQYTPIRKALLARGWVEKFHASYKDHLSDEMKRYQNYPISDLLPLMRRENLTVTCKNLIKSKLLGGYQVDFYWGTNDEAFKENSDKIKLTTINKLKREIFSYTNKQGLCEASKMSYWYQKNNVSKLNHPRTYSLGKNGDIKGFTEDFNITAAMSLLKWVVKMNSTKECKLLSSSGKIPLETFDFALNECCKFIKKGRHEDIDVQIPDATENEWNQFLDYFYKLVHYNNHFKDEGSETEDSLVRKSNYIISNLKAFYPYVDMDGMMNIWILKPTASSRGRGIHMCRTVQYVLKTIKQNSNIRYIIQKYIERPLLIYNTKFDIRQWFLISNCSPLTIWMYRDCYLRFSSQTYNLRKLHESIHLTNNSVQCKYKNTSIDTALPSYNMWDSTEFKKYLSNIGYPNVFAKVIYPGMKQCITAAVLMHQDKMVVRKKCFELFGADFILTEDFQPWLLEINSNPALFASTPVTARMCPKVLEDVIKVIIDYAQNSKADTGLFEMIYKEQITKLPTSTNLEVKGLPLRSSYFFNAPDHELSDSLNTPSHDGSEVNTTQKCLKNFGEEIKKTLKNLLQIIQSEKQKRGLEGHQNQNLTLVA